MHRAPTMEQLGKTDIELRDAKSCCKVFEYTQTNPLKSADIIYYSKPVGAGPSDYPTDNH